MLLNLSWLRDFVPYEGTASALGERLTMVGLELDGIQKPFEFLRPIVTGLVAECDKHPESEKLSVCRVDVGTEVLDIVCGAPNVAKGQIVAVVKVGTTLPGGLTIKKSKLRGVPSNGMICSEAELELSDEHDGIMVLPSSTPIGISLVDALNLNDEVLDISITPNRGDCLSVLGLARETAVLFDLPLSMPKLELAEVSQKAADVVSFETPDATICRLYQGRVLEGADIGQSPAFMRFRLKSVGLRAISNLVDVTNYILMELGQPLHAFDLDKVKAAKISVKPAVEGEKLVTLDGQERLLTGADITIRDCEKAIGLGGVMGGLNSEITAESRRVFLECAIFNPSLIRKTARRLALHSDAAYRFERGVDQQNAEYALNRAADLMARYSGAKVLSGLVKSEPAPFAACSVALRHKRAESLLGIELDKNFCESTLQKLGCKLAESAKDDGKSIWTVEGPSWRHDLSREADFIEELVRIYGVDRIPAVLPSISRDLERADSSLKKSDFLHRVKHWGKGAGLSEAVNYSFVGHKDLDRLGIESGDSSQRISIMNPLTDDLDVLRTHLAPGLLNSLRNNLAQSAGSVRLFEVASTFHTDKQSETTAKETASLGLLFCGQRFDQNWPQKEGELDYLDLKGVIEHLLTSFLLPQADFIRKDSQPWLKPGVEIRCEDQVIGFAGKVKTDIADHYHAKKPVWMAELNLETIFALHAGRVPRFSPLPVFPPVRRDITFIAAPEVTADSIMNAISSLKLQSLSQVEFIDFYQPEGENRNLTFRLTFRNPQRTLKDTEADKQRELVVEALQKMLPVRV